MKLSCLAHEPDFSFQGGMLLCTALQVCFGKGHYRLKQGQNSWQFRKALEEVTGNGSEPAQYTSYKH
jgi:hypothetical protein